jgi:hypothetical protein
MKRIRVFRTAEGLLFLKHFDQMVWGMVFDPYSM